MSNTLKTAIYLEYVYLQSAHQAPAAQALTVRPNLLSKPETLGNWTDGRISCWHSAPTLFCFKILIRKKQASQPKFC